MNKQDSFQTLLQKDIDALFPEVVHLRRTIHQNPELGREEHQTQAFILDFLTKHNIECKKIADTGVLGVINPHIQSKVIALRADIDALPTTELNDTAYKSKVPGKMHACGHDAHTAILMGTAKLLKQYENRIDAQILLLFQPDEEDLGGAQRMISNGAIDHAQLIFGLHVTNDYPKGQIALRYGQMNASSDMYKIIVKGKAAHGAYPDRGVDTIVAAAQMIVATQSIVARNVSPLDSAVITFGKIQGGEVRNSLAGEVELDGIVRSLTPETRLFVNQRLTEIFTNIASAMNVSVDIQHIPSYPALMNDDNIVNIVKESAENVVGKSNVQLKQYPSLGVEDFAYYCEKIPGAFFNLGTGNTEKGFVHNIHSQRFDIDEEAMKVGIAMQINNVFNAIQYLAKGS